MIDTETHRLQCEARYLLSLPLPELRTRLGLVLDKRGAAAQKALRDEMVRQYKDGQA